MTIRANTNGAYSAVSLSSLLEKSGFCTSVPLPCIPGMNLIDLAYHSISIPLANRGLLGKVLFFNVKYTCENWNSCNHVETEERCHQLLKIE